MRPLSSTALARAADPAQAPVWLLKLWSPDDQWFFATAAISYAGADYLPLLGENLRWRESLPFTALPGGYATASATAELLNLDPAVAALRVALAAAPAQSIQAELRLGWLDRSAPATALDSEDALLLLDGGVASFAISPRALALTLADAISLRASHALGRILRAAMISGHTAPAANQHIPWIIGRREHVPLLPLDAGFDIHLAHGLAAGSTNIQVDTLGGFPTSGTVQIGPELITYTAIDTGAVTIGSGGSGVTRSQPTLSHAAGSAVRLVPSGGFNWLVADHACELIEEVRADGVALAGADWSATTMSVGAQTAQIINLAAWPTTSGGSFRRNLTATVQGWPVSGGGTMQIPSDIALWLYAHPRLLALDVGLIDSSQVNALRSWLASSGAICSRYLHGTETLGTLLRELLREAGLWLTTGGARQLLRWQSTPQAGDAVLPLDAAQQLVFPPAADLADTLRAAAALPTPHWPPPAVELHGLPQPGIAAPTLFYPDSAYNAGPLPRRIAVNWLELNCDDALRLADLAFNHATQWLTQAHLTTPLGCARLTCAETILYDAPHLNLENIPAWVTAMEIDLSKSPWLQVTLAFPAP